MQKQNTMIRKNKIIIMLFLVFSMFFFALPFLAKSTVAVGDVPIDATNFPDANFRTFVKQYDKNYDNVLQQSEIQAVTDITCSGEGISDLKGIEHFTAMSKIYCDRNKLTNLDVSKNTALEVLYCSENKLTYLDVSKNTALKKLVCELNQLTNLDVTKNTALKNLVCNSNQLTSLDLTKNTALEDLECQSNQLTNLDLTKNTALIYLKLYSNQLTNLDVTKNTALKDLECMSNQLTNLDVTKNTALKNLVCNSNQLTSLDLTKNTELEKLFCDSNQLTNLDVTSNAKMTQFYCRKNQLTALDVSNNIKIESFSCDSNNLSALDLSNNNALVRASFDTQIVYIKNASFNNGNFIFNLAALPGLNPAKVKNLTKEDGSALPSGVVYDSTSGTLTVSKTAANTLPKLKYIYDHSSPTVPDKKMVVTLTLEHPFVVTLKPNNSIDNPNEILLPDGASSYTLPSCSFTAPTGKKFKCWKVAGAEKQPGETINVTENIDVDAVWEFQTFTVTYVDENGQTIGTPQTVEYGQNATAPAVPQKPGYTGAWDNDGTNITANRTINAVYTANVNNVTFDPNGGNGSMQPMTVTTGQSLMLPTCTFTPPTGKVFDKWDINGTKYDAGTTVNGIISDTVVKATWTTAKFTVTYKDEGGNIIGTPQTVEYGQNATPETVPAKTGYTGVWSNDGKNVTQDLVITPIYKVITFTVTYKADGVLVSTQTVEYGKNATAPAIPPKAGYTATGWDNNGQNITSDRTINAVYTPNINNVTFDPNGGNGTMQPMTVTTGQSFMLPTCTFTPPTGKVFDKWEINGTKYDAGATVNGIISDAVVKATWTTAKFTVTYKDESGNVIGTPQTVEYGQNATPETVPAKTGYTGSWSNDGKNVTSDLVITPIYKVITFTVTYKADGVVVDTQTVNYGQNANAPQIPPKPGYTATGWDNDGTNITSDRTINAKYTANVNNVTFNPNGGNGTMQPMTVTTGQSFMLPSCTFTPPTGKVFDKWEINGTKYDAGATVNEIISDTVVKATWTTAKFTVTYVNENGQTIGTPQIVEYGQNAVPEQIPPKVGYNAVWDNDGTNVTQDLTIRPVYSLKIFTVTYKADGVVVDTQTVEYGQNATAPAIPPKPGYTATGWDNDGTNITSDRTINAVYTPNINNVTFDPNGGSGSMSAMTVKTGENLTLPSNTFTPPTGKVFDKWEINGTKYNVGAKANNIVSDTVVKATWKTDTNKPINPNNGKNTAPTNPNNNNENKEEDNRGTYEVKIIVDGRVVDTQIIKKGENATLPPVSLIPKKEGYIVEGWDNDGKNITAVTEIHAVYRVDPNYKKDQSLEKGKFAEYLANHPGMIFVLIGSVLLLLAFLWWLLSLLLIGRKHTVEYMADGKLVSTQKVKHGENTTVPLIPQKDGYTAIGWDNDGTNIKSNITINAKYRENVNK